MDGVLTDTVELHYRSFKRLAMEEKVPFNREINERLRGLSREDSLAVLFNKRVLSRAELQRLMERKNEYFLELAAAMNSGDLLPGVKELLDLIKERGFKLGLASSSKNAKYIIEKLAIESYFDSISDGNDVKQAKPAPDLFLHAAARLKVEPSACVVVEDAAAGIKAAREAGMTVIGIGPEERVGAADFRFDSIADIDLERVLREIENRKGN
ncbi:MAG: beta-phosphoglucomutase [Firmicutes bacterium]|nr:beta-phosphoglucomutase [Bacillota bacterium]